MHYILVKDSHPSDVRFRKALQAFSDHLLYDQCSLVTVIFWDRHRASALLPLSPRIKYVSIYPFLFGSKSHSLLKPVWSLTVFVYVCLLRARDLFMRVETLLYCADFLAAFSCSFSCLIGRRRCKFIYDIYDEVGLLFCNKFLAHPLTFLDFFPHLVADRIVKVSQNRVSYSEQFAFRRPSGVNSDFENIYAIIPNSPSCSPDYEELRVREFPGLSPLSPSTNKINKPESEFFHCDYFVVSGYLSDARGIASILKFAKDFPEYQFSIFGSGLSSFSRQIIDNLPNVILFKPLSQLDLFRVQLDSIGIFALYDPKIPINRVAVPNKVWDSVICRVPLIVNAEILATADARLADHSVAVPYHYDPFSWADLRSTCLRQRHLLLNSTYQTSIPDTVSLYSSLIRGLA